MEDFAVSKFPKRGKCAKSVFMNGWHRVGSIPTLSLLDGAAPGDWLTDICLECGKVFGLDGFIVKNQPNTLSR